MREKNHKPDVCREVNKFQFKILIKFFEISEEHEKVYTVQMYLARYSAIQIRYPRVRNGQRAGNSLI